MKNIKVVCFTILLLFVFSSVKAGSASMSTSQNTVTVGSTVTVTVNAKKLGGTYTMYSSNSSVLSGDTKSDSIYSDSSTIVGIYKAIAPGKATIVFKSTGDCMLSDISTDECYDDTLYATINVVERSSGGNNSSNNNGSRKNNAIDINKTYSGDNYLKLLDVDGYDITPKFNKDTLEYK